MYLLDTDHLSILEYDNADSVTLQMRLERVPPGELATTVITYEEQMRGWLARVAHANTTERMRNAYSRLQTHIETFAGIPVLPFDDPAIEIYERLRHARLRVGTMDLKIAAIALSKSAMLLTRNRTDFERVPNLRFEDWSSGHFATVMGDYRAGTGGRYTRRAAMGGLVPPVILIVCGPLARPCATVTTVSLVLS